MATVTDSETGITTTYYYDLIDRLVKYEEKGTNFTHSVTYIYDEENNLSSLTEVINGVKTVYSYAYDNDNRITSVTVGNGTTVISSVSYTYDAFGRITDQVTKHGDSTVLNKAATFTDPSATSTSGQVASYNGFTYTYDDNGNILSVQDGAFSHYYEYDSAGQVVRETDMFLAFSTTWTYDEAGNIIYKTGYDHPLGSLENIAYDSQSIYTYGDSNWGDLLTAYDGATITYDEIGNPLNDSTWTYTWEHGRQLASMSQIDKDTQEILVNWEYAYNADGLRTKRTNGTTTYNYVYNGSQLAQMTVGNDTLTFAYDAAGIPLTVTHNGTVYYYSTNVQGDIIAILNSSGTAVVTYTYDAWSNPGTVGGTLASTLGALNPLRYRGYVYDQETGLYYLQSRYYDPIMCRFINIDTFVSTGQGVLSKDMYTYCMNNPIMGSDIAGRRTYFINGINNEEESDSPDYAYSFAEELESLGVKDVEPVPAYNLQRGLWGTITGVSEVIQEMFNQSVYSDMIASYIMEDLENNPLEDGEELNIIGYSGGGQIALNVAEKLDGKVDNVVLIGSPVLEISSSEAKITLIWAGLDPLSWNIGWGYDSHFIGWIGHTDYFNSDHIGKTAAIVSRVIK